MSILVVGINHRSSPLSLLERVTVVPDRLGKAVAGLAMRDNIREAVVLSTCNRTEVYVVTELFHGAYADVRDFLCELGDLSADELIPHLYSQHDSTAVGHLFEVAAGLDSAVLGESEILGQVRSGLGDRPARGCRPVDAEPAVPHARSRPASVPAPRPASAGAPRRSATPPSR